jgi:D-serine deaminase-like pyridoxal phosphate-dependent protein
MNENSILHLETPCLLLDVDKLDRNVRRLNEWIGAKGVTYRPHLKTAKSVDVARTILPSLTHPVTVSTLKEAEIFAAAGLTDILYAVGIAPAKLGRVVHLRKTGVDLVVILDSIEQARAVAAASREANERIPALIEIDSDGHRGGVAPEDGGLLARIAEALVPSAELRGVLTHAGSSYSSRSREEVNVWAGRERDAVLSAAALLRKHGHEVAVVSVGSTPTALSDVDLPGVTEVRAGVSMFFDLVQAGVGVCSFEDIALSVMTTVIGHQRDKGMMIVDAGWMALSRDRGTAAQLADQKYGLVCDMEGDVLEDLLVLDANQEHGIVGIRKGSAARLPEFPVGTRLRILPNHACATAAQHSGYHVVGGANPTVQAFWPRFGGW